MLALDFFKHDFPGLHALGLSFCLVIMTKVSIHTMRGGLAIEEWGHGPISPSACMNQLHDIKASRRTFSAISGS